MIVHIETQIVKIDIIKHRLNFRFEAGTSVVNKQVIYNYT